MSNFNRGAYVSSSETRQAPPYASQNSRDDNQPNRTNFNRSDYDDRGGNRYDDNRSRPQRRDYQQDGPRNFDGPRPPSGRHDDNRGGFYHENRSQQRRDFSHNGPRTFDGENRQRNGDDRARQAFSRDDNRGSYGRDGNRGGYGRDDGRGGYGREDNRGGYRYDNRSQRHEYSHDGPRTFDGENRQRDDDRRSRQSYNRDDNRGGGYGRDENRGGYRYDNRSQAPQRREFANDGPRNFDGDRQRDGESNYRDGGGRPRQSYGGDGNRGGYRNEGRYQPPPPPPRDYQFDRSRTFDNGQRQPRSLGRDDPRNQMRNNDNEFSYNQGERNGYRSFRDDDGSRGFNRERTEENHAPRDYKPEVEDMKHIFEIEREDPSNSTLVLDDDADIEVSPSDMELYCDRWENMELSDEVLRNIEECGYARPRKIQAYTIPYIKEGLDIMCQGETGSGKTAAFMVPIVDSICKLKVDAGIERGCPYALVISPTRELAHQLFNQARKFSNNTAVVPAVAYGEYAMRTNINDIQRGCDILVACLGRLIHLLKEGHVSLGRVKYLVLDEADRLMLENSNSQILELLRWPEMPGVSDRQTMLFSATLKDPFVINLSKQFLKRDHQVVITALAKSNKRVHYQIYPVLAPVKKLAVLKELVQATRKNGVYPRFLVFVNRKLSTDRVSMFLSDADIPSTTIHGDRGQHLRDEALANFKSGKSRVLVATDVCARGVDIKDLDYVINYDLPNDIDTFIQRCGRTGRTKQGFAISLYHDETDGSLRQAITQIIDLNKQEVPRFMRSGQIHECDYELHTRYIEQTTPGGTNTETPSPVEDEVLQSNACVPDRHVDQGWGEEA